MLFNTNVPMSTKLYENLVNSNLLNPCIECPHAEIQRLHIHMQKGLSQIKYKFWSLVSGLPWLLDQLSQLRSWGEVTFWSEVKTSHDSSPKKEQFLIMLVTWENLSHKLHLRKKKKKFLYSNLGNCLMFIEVCLWEDTSKAVECVQKVLS